MLPVIRKRNFLIISTWNICILFMCNIIIINGERQQLQQKEQLQLPPSPFSASSSSALHQRHEENGKQHQFQPDFLFDINSDEDELIDLTEPPTDIIKDIGSRKPLYEKGCQFNKSNIMLALVLRENSWIDILPKKKDRATRKLQKFFAINEFSIGSITAETIKEMTKYVISQGTNKLHKGKVIFGRIEFMLGCGDKMSSSGQLIANQIKQQMKDDSINDISGLDFGWWIIYKKINDNFENGFKSRHRRQTDDKEEGSGENDEYDYYEEDENDDTENGEDDAAITEVPNTKVDQKNTELHPHRHHHGVEKTDLITERVTSSMTTEQNSDGKLPLTEYDEDDDDVDDYDDEDDQFVGNTDQKSKISIPHTTILPRAIDTTESFKIKNITLTTAKPITTEYIEPEYIPPIIRTRLPKIPVTAGKPFSFTVPLETFYDTEDGTNLKLTLLDKYEQHLDNNSWIQFNPDTREIYGLPLEENVSKWLYKLRATDSDGESITEILDVSVQQHKAHRSVNHEISIGIKLNEPFANNVDWQIRLIRGIVETLGDSGMSSVVVREIRSSIDPTAATFIYTNESLPKDVCPEEKLDKLFQRLTVKSLSASLSPEITIKSVSGRPIGACAKIEAPKPKSPKESAHVTKNYPPVPRNPVDRVNATIGKLLVFKVPKDTFYDPEDGTDLKLTLLSNDRKQLDPKHWLQFDTKNQEFYGVPKTGDRGQKEYLLTAEDHKGLLAHDGLVVDVTYPNSRDYTTLFEMTLGMAYDDFNNSIVQRRFIERLAKLFGDATTANIQIRAIRKIDGNHTFIGYYNTTLYRPHNVCPSDVIAKLRKVLLYDETIQHKANDVIGSEFKLSKINLTPLGACIERTTDHVHHAIVPIKPDDTTGSGFKDDYLLTFILPAIIILAMILVATIIACYLHRRRMTGKMELGDEEERRSFRSKGIPVIFQDELDEKPEIGNKSPIILKDEKPPLLPPSYNSMNPDDHEDMDEYVPPPAVVMGGRETRGKSPVTPSYRKPPPYVSP